MKNAAGEARKAAEGWEERITVHPHIMSGRPCVRGRRIPTVIIAGRFFSGDSVAYIARDHTVPITDVEDALRFEFLPKKKRDRVAAAIRSIAQQGD